MIWAGLKYHDDRPVLTDMDRADFMGLETHLHGTHGDSTAMHGKESTVGHETLGYVKTQSKLHSFVEAREALQLALGGEVLNRAR